MLKLLRDAQDQTRVWKAAAATAATDAKAAIEAAQAKAQAVPRGCGCSRKTRILTSGKLTKYFIDCVSKRYCFVGHLLGSS